MGAAVLRGRLCRTGAAVVLKEQARVPAPHSCSTYILVPQLLLGEPPVPAKLCLASNQAPENGGQ
ncbi:MAG: hypothetical protein ACUVXF_06420, partial [Desulfobaccales bacterium]